MPRSRADFAVLGVLLCAAACGVPSRRADHTTDPLVTEVPGFRGVRAVDGYPSRGVFESFLEGLADRVTQWRARDGAAGRVPFEMLVLSSGGANGSFGAGLLLGWTDSGERPEFDMVTGVSVGALIAPFAFVGPSEDETLRAVFARLESRDIQTSKGRFAAIFGESTNSAKPLERLIARCIDDDLVAKVADAHEDGRRLFVGTTNLDSGDFVIWNVGAIATRRDREARDLIRRVLRASASIPLVYEPVTIPVETPSGRSEELHVDGAVSRPLFLPNQTFDSSEVARLAGLRWSEMDSRIYVVTNGALRKDPRIVTRGALDIASEAVLSMMYTLLRDDMFKAFVLARVWGCDFFLQSVPRGQEIADSMDFEAPEAATLFELGYAQGARGHSEWPKEPPSWMVDEDVRQIRSVLRIREAQLESEAAAEAEARREEQQGKAEAEQEAELRVKAKAIEGEGR